MPVNTAVRAVVCSPGKAARLGALCLRVDAFTFYTPCGFVHKSAELGRIFARGLDVAD